MWLICKFLFAIILVEALTEIVTKSELFNPIKARVFKKSDSSIFLKWVHDLLDCGYCFSVWVASIVSILFFKDINLLHFSIDWFFVTMVLHRLSNLFHNFMDSVRK